MSFFPAARSAMLAGSTVRFAHLLFFDFLGQPSRYWTGAGPLLTLDGNTWQGLDRVGRIDALPYANGVGAPKASFSIAALDPAIQVLAQTQASAVKGRQAVVSLQFFDASWSVLDAPYAVWSGAMDTLSYQVADSDAGKTYRVTLTVEGAFTNRNRPAAAFYDPQDQAARGYPQDTGFDQIPALAGQTIVWKPSS